MTQRVDFDVTVAGDSRVIRVEYEERTAPAEIANNPYEPMKFNFQAALDELERAIGHSNYEITYWLWL